jgi:hypothetical protein
VYTNKLNARKKGGHRMKKGSLIVGALALLIAAPVAARADWCLNLTGSTTSFPFPSSGLFVHFKGYLPKRPGQMVPLTGRIDGRNGGPVFGTAVVHRDGSQIEIAATFFEDAMPGQFWMAMDAPFTSGVFGYGYGDYQTYGVNGSSGQGTVVSCSAEPDYPVH